MEWLLIALAIASLSLLQGDHREDALVCVLSSCTYIISEDSVLDSESEVLLTCEPELLSSLSCPELTK